MSAAQNVPFISNNWTLSWLLLSWSHSLCLSWAFWLWKCLVFLCRVRYLSLVSMLLCQTQKCGHSSLCLLHKKVPLPLEMCEPFSLITEILKQICPSKDSWRLRGRVWVTITHSGEEFMSPVNYRTIDWLSRQHLALLQWSSAFWGYLDFFNVKHQHFVANSLVSLAKRAMMMVAE